MKRAIAIALTFVSLAAAAQTKKKAAAPKPKPPNYLEAPFDPTVTTLGTAFAGHNFYETYLAHVLAPRGEYESTADYEKRTAASPAATYAFVLDPKARIGPGTRYDADRQELEVTIPLGFITIGAQTLGYDRSLAVGQVYTDKGEYVGSNVFGVKKTISEAIFQNMVLFPKRRFESDQLTFRLPLEAGFAKALREGEHLGIAAIVSTADAKQLSRSTDGWESTGSRYSKPTLDSPHDIMAYEYALSGDVKELLLFDKRDGRILSRVDPYTESVEAIHKKEAHEAMLKDREETRDRIIAALPPGTDMIRISDHIRGYPDEEKEIPSGPGGLTKRRVYKKYGLAITVEFSAKMSIVSVEKIPFE